MDPQATLSELLQAVDDRDWDRVDELAEALLHWLERRGFPPLTLGAKSLGHDWHRAIATFVCRLAQSQVRAARQPNRPGGIDASPGS